MKKPMNKRPINVYKLGKDIMDYRFEHNISLTEMGNRLCCTRQSVAAIEDARVSNISIETLRNLMRLGMVPEYI